ncbi:hypothetical protein [Nonomuraea sp. NPDC049129]|uniref:hypothetical protein n=1 Tax=Nonomuraea sp. NPDC049129 TaxID=3155272 RepID=UPI0033D0E159
MHIYRVAHKTHMNGKLPAGPYVRRYAILGADIVKRLEWMYDLHAGSSHSGPQNDPLLQYTIFSWERCGFDSLDNLYRWFEHFTEDLHECGFRIYVYDVAREAVRVGKNGQALFAEDCASELYVADFDLNYTPGKAV